MTATIGPDWQSFFEIIVPNCNSSLFQKAENPFYVEHSVQDRGHKRIWSLDELKEAH